MAEGFFSLIQNSVHKNLSKVIKFCLCVWFLDCVFFAYLSISICAAYNACPILFIEIILQFLCAFFLVRKEKKVFKKFSVWCFRLRFFFISFSLSSIYLFLSLSRSLWLSLLFLFLFVSFSVCYFPFLLQNSITITICNISTIEAWCFRWLSGSSDA